MSINQVLQSLLSTPTRHKHHEHSRGQQRTPRGNDSTAAQEEKESERRSQTAQHGRSFEDFERAQQLAAGQSGRASPGSTQTTARVAAAGTANFDDPMASDESAASTSVTMTATSATDASRSAIAPTQATAPSAPPSNSQAPVSATSPSIAATYTNVQPPPAAATSPLQSSEAQATAGRIPDNIPQPADAQAGAPTGSDPAQHYGTLPMLVAGQLVELDLYSVSSKEGGASDSVRRLILSLSNGGAAATRVTAEASEGRLKVSLAGSEGAAPEVLDEQVRAVGDLAARLGWQFESVDYVGNASAPTPAGEGLDRLL